jgi:hypothetical protein
MIPTMILFGLVLGRWWRSTLVAAAVAWPLLLLAGGILGVGPQLLEAAALGVANAAVGVAPYQVVLHLVRMSHTKVS